MKICCEKTKSFNYFFEFSFSWETVDFCRFLKEKLGWQKFSFYEKKWRFNDLGVVDLIIFKYPQTEMDEIVKLEFSKYQLDKQKEKIVNEQAEHIKTKKTSNLIIKGLKLPLYEYQKIGTEFLINADGRALLFDSPGVGKSCQALAYVVHQKISKTLVICPAVVKYVWENEIKKWTDLKYYIFSSNGGGIDYKEMAMALLGNDIFVINFDILHKYHDVLKSARFDALIVDECHLVKNISARRSKITCELARDIPKLIFLSGTPVLNRPAELFNVLQMIDKGTWDNWYAYTLEFCNGHHTRFGYDTSGASKLDKLQLLISKYFLRRTKDEVLLELPPKRFIDVPIQLDKDKRWEYDLVMTDFQEYLSSIKNKTEEEIRRSMAAETLTKLNELRQITTLGKLDAAEEMIQNIIDAGEKVLVFSSYNKPLEILSEKFKETSVIITGKTNSDLLRKESIEMFQNNPLVKIFFGGTKAAGVGITLTAASNVIFLDYTWNLSEMNQALDRCHRPGQKSSSVNIYQLFAQNTIDEFMKNLIQTKQEIIEKIIDSKETTSSHSLSIIRELVEEIKKDNKKRYG